MEFLHVPSIFETNRFKQLKQALIDDLQDLISFVDHLKVMFDFDSMDEDIAQDFAIMMGLQIANFGYLGKDLKLGLKKYTHINYFFGSEKVFHIIAFYHRFRLTVYNIWRHYQTFTPYEILSTDVVYDTAKQQSGLILTSEVKLELEFFFKFENDYFLFSRNFEALREDFEFYKIGYQILDIRFLHHIQTRTKTETRQEGFWWLVKDFTPVFEGASGGSAIQMDTGLKMDEGQMMDVFFPYNDILDQYTLIELGSEGSTSKTYVANSVFSLTAYYVLDSVKHKWIFYTTLPFDQYFANPLNEVHLKNPTTDHVLCYAFHPKVDFVGKDIKILFEFDWYTG